MSFPKPSLFLFTRLIFGLILFGFGLALVVVGNFGVSPWEVFHQGISRRTPLSIGTTIICIGIIILFFLFLLKEPMGIGTVANVLVIGLVVDITLSIFGEITDLFPRVTATLFGPIIVALGSGFYIGTNLGPGPRDGLMTAFNRRGVAIWKARTVIEGSCVIVGLLLGGTIGWGTVWFLISVGPSVQFFLRRLQINGLTT
jgi:uncharacterized membrane protein YczE|tara:strand:+ start:1985 stop:2584 length:600 start_codon:yes stop_codon:yes gene_type:complete